MGFHGRAELSVDGDQTALPREPNSTRMRSIDREIFRSEVATTKSYLVNLGNLAFSSPAILGGVARQAGVVAAPVTSTAPARPFLHAEDGHLATWAHHRSACSIRK